MKAERELRLTKQRSIILEELRSVKTHPTADEVYQMVRQKLPRISLGTVYRNLELMAEHGIIRKIATAGTQKRFDGTAEHHYHIRCERCGRVADLDLPPEKSVEVEAQKHTDFTVIDHNLEFVGICPSCRQKEPNHH